MPSLAEFQARLAHELLADTVSLFGLPAAWGRASIAEALQVHRATILGALTGALRLGFPTVERLVGDRFFDQAAAAFIRTRPPAGVRLDLYGAAFPAFLADYAPAASLPYLPDVGRFDLAIEAVLAGPDVTVRRILVFDAAVSLSLPVGLTVLKLQWPTDLIRAHLEAGDDSALARLALYPEARWLALWREGRTASVKTLRAAAGLFLSRLLATGDGEVALDAALADGQAAAVLYAIQAEVMAARFASVIRHPPSGTCP